MTQRENITLQQLAMQLDQYISEDKAWKDEVTQKLTPLVEERSDRIILQNAGKYVWKGLLAVIIFLGAVGTLIHYLPDILRVFKLK